jgi:phenylalanyl-tRNA synthetase beta chain
MIVSRRWLEAMLGRALDPRDLEHRLSMLGAPVESVVPLHQDLGDVLIAEVLEAKKHANADRLSLCLVNAGWASPVEVVRRTQAGKKYPTHPSEPRSPGPLLERRKTGRRRIERHVLPPRSWDWRGPRGTALDTDAAPGTRLSTSPIADHQVVIEVTANRPDLLCHRWRELGASLGAVVKLPEIPGGRRAGGKMAGVPPASRLPARGVVDGVEIRLEDKEGPRYMAAVIRGVRVKKPAWLAAARQHRAAVDQQRRRCDQLHPVRAEPAVARVRPCQTAGPGGRHPARTRGRKDRHARRGESHADGGHDRHL